jgi:hypothetical protein
MFISICSMHARVCPKKLGGSQVYVVWGSLILAFFKDCLFPIFIRLVALGLYITLVYMTFMIDSKNVKDLAKTAFQAASALALSKAVLEFVLPAMLLIIFFIIMRFSAGKNGYEKHNTKSLATKKVRNTWPVVGATLNGLAAGGGVVIFLKVMDPLKLTNDPDHYAIVFASLCGVIGCIVSLLLALILESCHESRFFGTSLLSMYTVISSFGLAWLGTSKYYSFGERIVMSIGTVIVLYCASAYTFWPPAIPRGGPKAMRNLDPAVLPLLNSARIISAPVGAVAGVFVIAKLHQPCLDMQGTYWGFGTAVLSGLIVSLIYSMACDAIIDKRSAQLAMTVGTFLSLIIGVYAEWWIGLLVGSIVGSISGAIMEHYTMKAVMAETVLMFPGDAEPYKPTSRSDGSTLWPSQPVKGADNQELAIANTLPTLVTATPRSSMSSGTDGMKNFSNDAFEPALVNDQRFGSTRSKRFGLQSQTSTGSAMQASNMAWLPSSPQGLQDRSPSAVAMAHGWVGNAAAGGAQSNLGSGRSASTPPELRAAAREANSSARQTQGSPGGAAQGGLPTDPGSGRREPRKIASVVRAATSERSNNS